jgi:hypothetical protein
MFNFIFELELVVAGIIEYLRVWQIQAANVVLPFIVFVIPENNFPALFGKSFVEFDLDVIKGHI